MGDRKCPLEVKESSYTFCKNDHSVDCRWGVRYEECPVYGAYMQAVLCSHGVISVNTIETLVIQD